MNDNLAGASPVDRPVRPDPERAAFERWCGEDGRWPQAIERNGNGYKLMSTHSAWMAWRACWPQAQAAERERCAKIVDMPPGTEAWEVIGGEEGLTMLRELAAQIRSGGQP